MHLDIFIPCFIDQLSPETGIHMVRLLEKMGCTINYNPNQTCCGQPAYNSGFEKEAKNIAKKFLKDFNGKHPIVAPSGSCTGYVRNYLPHHFDNTPLQNDCNATRLRIFEFAEYVVANLDYKQLSLRQDAKVTYHDGCGALRECKIKEQPRALLAQVAGTELVEMKEAETCCGFGGTFAVKFEGISTGMAYTKVDSAVASGASFLVSSDYSCLMHLKAYIEKHQLPIKPIHLIDYLYNSLPQ